MKKVLDRLKPAGIVRAVKKAKKKAKKFLKKLFSDERLKRDILPLGIENGFNTYTFRYMWGTQRYKGVMAQEVEEVLPTAVRENNYGNKAVRYEKLIPLLLQSIKELKTELDELKSSKI